MKTADLFGSYILCDDAHVAIVGGKFHLSGMYTGELLIPHEGIQASQLIFIFHIHTPLDKPFKRLGTRIHFPGHREPFSSQAPDAVLQRQPHIQEGRTMLNARFAIPVMLPILNSGKIAVFITHERGEIELTPTWISSTLIQPSDQKVLT